ncbi:hypothetical protein DDZ18_13600 [Marinicauda salina]|uniref:Uncharacterized protein n=1 Tax=Marinicauda salina TaxID=2135793 RepID=A0A2U2BR03_9PROT|nr:hypothetical protein [Marinicauda salina]PWE16447.1 hypothetical protein DDZ18_13600 [Marinicauda salina]
MSDAADSVVIDKRYCGPPNSGNGGYSCGVMARLIDGPAMCGLKAPPPLDRPLRVSRNGAVALLDGETLIGAAEPADAPDLDIPALPPREAIEAASSRYVGFERHAFPGCYVCGPERAEGDGLRIFAGPLDGIDAVAAPWTPDASLADADGRVGVEHVWAALDCPTWAAFGDGDLAALLARMTAEVRERPKPGEACAILAWKLGSEGRKHRSAAALYGETGDVLAVAEALWIEPKDPAAFA